MVLLVVLGLGLVGAANERNILDWAALRNYQAPATVAELASQDTMTPYARKVFYVNKPAIDGKAAFASVCPSGTEQTVVLGCYHNGQNGINLLQVTDPILNGVEQVTAAHETLHAAYERLSNRQRSQVNGWLEDYYRRDLQDTTIKEQIADYKVSEPHDVVNEMHSVFGTEVANLPPQLENYYKQYFTNRATIVAYYNDYQSAFSVRQATIKQDDAQLATWKSQIDTVESQLEQKHALIQQQQKTMQADKNSGNIAGYNAMVGSYNALVNNYNAGVAGLHALLAQYNQLVDSRNAQVLEQQQLAGELRTSSATINK